MTGTSFLPYAPLDVLKPLADGVWIVDGPEIRMRMAVFGFPFPTRMTVIRLPDGALWVHSPIAPDEALLAEVAALGEVRFLVSPNTLHYWWIPDWKLRFPAAEVWALPRLARTARRAIAIERPLEATPPAAWQGAIDQLVLDSKIFAEADFFHRPSRTLVLTDLIENFEPKRIRNPFIRLVARLGGVLDPDGKMPGDMRWGFGRNRDAVRDAVKRMIAWRPERIVIAHGRCYQADAVAELQRAFRWAL